MRKVVVVKIAELDQSLFVRAAIDQEWMLQLALAYEAKEDVPPIELAADGKRVVDGRHRIAARQYLDLEDIEAMVRSDLVSDEDIVAAAFKANRGQSKHMTTQDIEHSIEMLFEKGIGVRRVAELLWLNSSEAKKYVNNVRSRMLKQRTQKALDAIREGGLTAAQAAEQFNVDLDRVKEALRPTQKKAAKAELGDLKRKLTNSYKSYSSTSWKMLEDVFGKYDDGILSAAQVRAVLKHLQAQQKRARALIEDYQRRFEAKVAGDEDAAP